MKLGYQRALDGVRGISIAVVVVSHTTGGWPHAGLGVDVFFVLSGFLITVLLLQEWQQHGTISLRAFYRRRMLRLFPAVAAGLAAFLALTLAATIVGAATTSIQEAVFGVAAGATYFANAVEPLLPPGLKHLWSLAMEEQFYVVWPTLLVVLLRRRVRLQTTVLMLAAAVAVISVHRLLVTVDLGRATTRLYYAPDVRFDSILVGCLIGVAFVCGWPSFLASRRFLRAAWVPAALVVIAMLALTDWDTLAVPGGLVVAFTASVAVLILRVVHDQSSALARFLAVPPLVFLGRISYGLYVWHVIVMKSTTLLPPLVGAGLSVAIATASYYWLELRFLRRKRASAPIEPARAPVPVPAAA